MGILWWNIWVLWEISRKWRFSIDFRYSWCEICENGYLEPKTNFSSGKFWVRLGEFDGCKIGSLPRNNPTYYEKEVWTWSEPLRMGVCMIYIYMFCTSIWITSRMQTWIDPIHGTRVSRILGGLQHFHQSKMFFPVGLETNPTVYLEGEAM